MGVGRLAVVIVNYKTAKYLAKCISSLEVQPIVERVYVVDNDSGDKERQTLNSSYSDSSLVRLLDAPRNGGFGYGVNIGVAAAVASGFEAVWILNPDTVADIGCATLIVDALSDGWDFVSPVVVTGDTEDPVVWFAGGEVDMHKVATPHYYYGEKISEVSLPVPVVGTEFLSGAAIATTRYAWEKLGGFREDFFMYWEDADLSYRAVSGGLQLGVIRDAKVWHAVGGSVEADGASSLYYWHMQRNRAFFARQYVSRWRVLVGSGLLTSAKLVLAPLKERNRPLVKFAASISGLWRGVTSRSSCGTHDNAYGKSSSQ